jgi:uncharacterized protein (TIGR02271 family)
VPVTCEEVTIERRPAGETTSTATEGPAQSREDIKVPLKKEEVEVTKQPYVKEEVAVKKRPVTETRQVSEEVRSEKVNVSGSSSTAEEEKKESEKQVGTYKMLCCVVFYLSVGCM